MGFFNKWNPPESCANFTNSFVRSWRRLWNFVNASSMLVISLRHFARTIESSSARDAPWPKWGEDGWAASPAKHTGPLCQVDRKSIS